MIPVLDNSFFFQKENFKEWGNMNVCTSYFDLKNRQSNVFFLLFTLLVIYDTPTKRIELAISDWTDLEINSGAPVTWTKKPTAYIHIPVKVK